MKDFIRNPIIYEDMCEIYNSRKDWSCLKERTIFISGAAGMLASYLTYYLIFLNEVHNKNINIYINVRNIQKAREKFGNYISKPYIHLLDRSVIDDISTAENFDYIIHAASLASPQYYGKYPVDTILPNVVGTYKLLDKAKKDKAKAFLFFSSGDVYGNVESSENISEGMIGNIDFLETGSFYGESKRCGEAICRAYFLQYGVPTKVIRIAHTYSPTMDIYNDKRVFAEFVSNIINNEDIIMKSDGSAKRPFCYISDAITGMLKVMIDGEPGEQYNLGNDHEFISIKDLASTLISLYPDKKLQIVFSTREDIGYTPSKAIKTSTLSMNKLRSLKWEAIIDIKTGFKRVIDSLQWELQNNDK